LRACWDAQFTSSPAGDCLTKGASVLFFSQFESINNYILDRTDSRKSQIVDVRPEKKSRAEERRCGVLPKLRFSPESRRRNELTSQLVCFKLPDIVRWTSSRNGTDARVTITAC